MVQLAHAPLPVATRRGSAELGCAVLRDVPVLMQRRGCLQFFDLVDMPVIVHRHVRSPLCVMSSPLSVVAQRQIPMVRSCVSPIAVQLTSVVVVLCKAVRDSRAAHSCSLDKVVDIPRCVQRQPVVQRAENCSGPAVVARFLVAGVPVVQVVLVPLSAAMDAL